MLIRVTHPAARSSVDNTQPQEPHLRNRKNCPNKRGHL